MAFPSVLGQMRNMPLESVGGTVIALLIKAKKKQRQQLPVASYTQKDHLMAGILPVTARLQEQYSFEADVTQHSVESGAIVSDHVILRPVRVDLVFEINNIPDTAKAKATLDKVVDMWQSRQKVDLLTEHSLITDMICISGQVTNEAPEWGKLAFRVCFKQVKWVTLESIKYQKEKVTPAANTKGAKTPKKAQAPVKKGQKSTRRVSAAKKLFEGGK